MPGEKVVKADLGPYVITALRTGRAEHLKPIVGTSQDYRDWLNEGSGAGVPPQEVDKEAAAWAKEQTEMAASSLRDVRAFGAEHGIDWSTAAIREVSPILFEVRCQGQMISLIVPITGSSMRRMILLFSSGVHSRYWLGTLLSPDELVRLEQWHAGRSREEDLAVGQMLVHKSARESVLDYYGKLGTYYGKLGTREIKSLSMTVQVPASFDKDHPDTIVYDEWHATLTETGNDTLEFHGECTLGVLPCPITMVLKDRDVAKRESWPATVDGRTQVFSRVKGADRTFHSPSVDLFVLGAESPGGGVTLTLRDYAVVDFRIGSDVKAAQPDKVTAPRPVRAEK